MINFYKVNIASRYCFNFRNGYRYYKWLILGILLCLTPVMRISKSLNLDPAFALGTTRIRIQKAVLPIRIRMEPEILPGSGIIVPDPDPAKNVRAHYIIQFLFLILALWILDCVCCRTVVISKKYSNNRYVLDPE